MKLRTKLLLGYGGFMLALGVLGGWSARTLNQMSAVSGRIIAENYDSVVAAQDMKESLERQDSAALFELLGQHDRAGGSWPNTAPASMRRSRRPPPTSRNRARPRSSRPSDAAATTTIASTTSSFARRTGARPSTLRCSSPASTRSGPIAIGSCVSIRRRCAARPTPRRPSRAGGSSSRSAWRSCSWSWVSPSSSACRTPSSAPSGS